MKWIFRLHEENQSEQWGPILAEESARTLHTWDHQKSPEIIKHKIDWEWNRIGRLPEAWGVTRLDFWHHHKTLVPELFSYVLKRLIKKWTGDNISGVIIKTCGGHKWNQPSKIMSIRIENCSFGYDLKSIPSGMGNDNGGSPDIWNLPHGGFDVLTVDVRG